MTDERLTAEQRRRVERAHPLVDQLARMMLHRLPRISFDELRSAGFEALVKCGLRYDPEHGVPFRSFSYYRVRGAMIDAARRATPEVRRRTRAIRTLESTQALLEYAEAKEVAAESDPRTLQQRVDTAAEIIAQATAAVVLARDGGPDPERVRDDETQSADDVLHDEGVREHVRRALGRCSDEEQAMIRAIYHHGLTMTEFGERVGMSKSTVSRRHAALLRRLAKELQRLLI